MAPSPIASLEAIAADLRGTTLFAGLPDDDLRQVASHAAVHRTVAGEVLFAAGDDSDGLYVVRSGRLKVSTVSSSGDELLLCVLEAGDSLGELSIADGGPRSATVTVVSAGEVVKLGRGAVLDLLQQRPAVAGHLLTELGAIVRRLTESSADLAFLDLPRRVAKQLVGHDEDEPFDLSQSALAAMVGGSRQAVNAALGNLERRGWIHRSGRTIRVRDRAALRRFAES